jgi:hypothetical protein
MKQALLIVIVHPTVFSLSVKEVNGRKRLGHDILLRFRGRTHAY